MAKSTETSTPTKARIGTKGAAAAPRVSALTRARSALKTVLKEDLVVPLSLDMLKETIPHIPTGSIVIDFAIGGKINKNGIAPCPGIPRGRITQLYGANSAGKTTLALTIAASVCANGGTVCYIDWEHEVEPRYAESLGVPIGDDTKFILIQPNTLEEGMKTMIVMISEGVDLIVLDSVGAGKPEKQVNQAVDEVGEQDRPGRVAAAWSDFLPKVKGQMASSNSTILAISQMRKTMSSMSGGGPDSAPQGGEAWKFFTSLRLSLRVLQKEKGKVFDPLTNKMEDKVVGTQVILKLDKNKVSDSAHNEFKYYMAAGLGIDNARSVAELAASYKIVIKSGSWLEWPSGPNGPVKVQGMAQFLKILREDPKLLAALFAQVTPKIMAAPPVIADTDAAENIDTDELMAMVDSIGSGPKKALAEAMAEAEETDSAE
jgi:recombination protein RecA